MVWLLCATTGRRVSAAEADAPHMVKHCGYNYADERDAVAAENASTPEPGAIGDDSSDGSESTEADRGDDDQD